MKTFGTLTHRVDRRDDGGWWLIHAEPHVALRAKRVFAQVQAQQRDGLVLSDTVETCRDLSWFLERYPLQMTEADRRHLAEREAAHRERETLIAQLLSGIRESRPFPLAIEPRTYQRIAAELALQTGGLLIADDVGLGKTATSICVISDPRARPALVVTMAHLTKQWAAEFRKFAPSMAVHVLKKSIPYDLTKAGTFPDVIISTYAKLAGWTEHLEPLVRSVTFDEIQELRRGSASKKGKAAIRLADVAEYRCGLSATPIYNYGSEIWNVVRAVAPNALGTRSEFLIEWCGETDHYGRSKLKNAKAFGTYLRESGIMVRRTREDVGRELPEVVRVPHEVDADSKPLRDISSAAERLASIIMADHEAERGAKFRASEELSSMVRHATGVAKAPYVAEFVRLIVESGEPVVLYGWHRDVYSIWLERLATLNPVLYTGSESPTQKEKSRQTFCSGDSRLLIMSLRSGAGLDGLQDHCRTVVFGELDWSPGVHEQCIGRIHRDGQAGSVVAYYLIANEGSDPTIADVLQVKRAQIEGIRNPDRDLIEKLDVSGDRVRELARRYLAERSPKKATPTFSLSEARVRQEASP